MKWTARIVVLVVAVVLIAGIANVMRTKPLDVDTSLVTRAPFEQTVVDDGIARVRERYTVSAPLAGTLARIDLHEGDAVEPGTVLARLLPLPSPLLDPRSREVAERRVASAVDAQRQAEATVERAGAAADQAQRELARIRKLSSAGAVPVAELDRANADARMRDAERASARFAAKVAQHDVEQARAALETFAPGARNSAPFAVTSPVHGQVLHVLHQSEGAVTAGTPLLEIGDPQALELAVDVLSQDAVAICPGMSARVVHWGGNTTLAAKVRRTEPAAFVKTSALGVEEHRVNVLLDLESGGGEWQALGDGFAVEVEVIVWSQPDVLQVPTSALFRHGAGWAAFAVDGGRARMREVQIGHRGPLVTEIVGGLAASETVIVHPSASVRDGASVRSR
ncbi:MAG TPA: HlyD family efflux transporter periplasmic adaptor subunit [Kofleriaceae bacterium]|nr:HlyD family efflux transporter periplasmic adaptor subunit [Kofleriaceae bacterium]